MNKPTPRTDAAAKTVGPYKRQHWEKNMPLRFLAVCKLSAELETDLAEAVAALKPFADFVKDVEPSADGMRIAFGLLSGDDNRGWKYTDSGPCMRDLINARAIVAKHSAGGGT